MFSEKSIILAPMAGISDRSFRSLCRSFGADLAVSEMVSAKGLVYGDRKSRILLAPDASDKPHWVQLFGSEPEIIREAAQIAMAAGADLIDINMGCPVRKVVKTGAGAALLREPQRAAKIMQALDRSPAVPYTIKVRTGWDHETFVLDDFIEMAANFNAKALICHPRTAKMMFSGKADWEQLFLAVEKASLPIIGSGDINDTETAKNYLAHPALSGIMLGRGTYGRPWFFREIKEFLQNNKSWLPDSDLKRETILKHGELLKEEYGEKHSLLIYRKHLAWYIKGIPGAAACRKKIFTLTDLSAIIEIVNELFSMPSTTANH